MKSGNAWPLVWGGLAIILAAVLFAENRLVRSVGSKGSAAPARVADAKLLPAFRLPEPPSGSQMVERPLFVPGRRATPPAAAASPIKKGQFVLQGTTLVGPLSIALLKEVATGTVHRVEKGGEIMGMTVSRISAEEVVLEASGDRESLPLDVAKGSGTAAAAVQRGPFQPPAGAPGTTAPPRAAVTPAAPAAGATQSPGTIPGTGRPIPVIRVPQIPATTPSTGQAMTAEEIVARRRAARQAQPQN